MQKHVSCLDSFNLFLLHPVLFRRSGRRRKLLQRFELQQSAVCDSGLRRRKPLHAVHSAFETVPVAHGVQAEPHETHRTTWHEPVCLTTCLEVYLAESAE